MTWRELDVAQFNNFKCALVIDVRSPGEHAAERIPHSSNIPLLSDAERAVIGTIYKEQGEMIARRQALTLISPKIPTFVESIVQARKHGQTVVVYCWRGGMRSESVCSVLSIAGIDCFRLTGGYKAWRTQVLQDFHQDSFPFDPVVLVGLTGTGKTELLHALHQREIKVLDLEGLANHRGSVFGGLGLGQQPTQKNFDGNLWMRLRELNGGMVFLEGESRRIGKLALPDCILNRIRKGPHILTTGSLEKRAQRIAADYLNPNTDVAQQTDRALQLLHLLKERLGTKRIEELQEMMTHRHIKEAVMVLLCEYYDPLYSKGISGCSPFVLEVDTDDPVAAADQVAQWSDATHLSTAT